MSVEFMTAIWNLPQMSATLKFVLLKLGDNANDDGVCWPSIGYIAAKCGISDRAVQGAISKLEKLGYLKRELRPRRSTVYHLSVPGVKTRQIFAENSAEKSAKPTPQDVHPNPERGSPRTVTEPSIKPPNPLKGEFKHSQKSRNREENHNAQAPRRQQDGWSDPVLKQWPQRIKSFYERSGFWVSHWGPTPDEAGTCVPKDMLERYFRDSGMQKPQNLQPR